MRRHAHFAAVIVQLVFAVPTLVGAAPQEAAQFAKTAREKLDLAQRLIAGGDFDSALRALREAEMFDETVEPARRAELRARAIAQRDDPAIQEAVRARRAKEELGRAAQAVADEKVQAEVARQREAEQREQEKREAEAARQQEQDQRERARRGAEALRRAFDLLRKGKSDEARAECDAALTLGVDTSKFMDELAAWEWRNQRRELTGERLRAFIERHGARAPKEAQKLAAREAKQERAEQERREKGERITRDQQEAARRLRDARFVWLPAAKNWANYYAKVMDANWDPRSMRGQLTESQIQGLLAAKERALPTLNRLVGFWRTVEGLAQGDECASAAETCARELGLAQDEYDYLREHIEDLTREAARGRIPK